MEKELIKKDLEQKFKTQIVTFASNEEGNYVSGIFFSKIKRVSEKFYLNLQKVMIVDFDGKPFGFLDLLQIRKSMKNS